MNYFFNMETRRLGREVIESNIAPSLRHRHTLAYARIRSRLRSLGTWNPGAHEVAIIFVDVYSSDDERLRMLNRLEHRYQGVVRRVWQSRQLTGRSVPPMENRAREMSEYLVAVMLEGSEDPLPPYPSNEEALDQVWAIIGEARRQRSNAREHAEWNQLVLHFGGDPSMALARDAHLLLRAGAEEADLGFRFFEDVLFGRALVESRQQRTCFRRAHVLEHLSSEAFDDPSSDSE